jgi:hypothetical protein
MKLALLLSRAALPVAPAAIAGLALGALAFEAFSAFVATLVLLTAAVDYARPPRPLPVRTAVRPRAERMPLAA